MIKTENRQNEKISRLATPTTELLLVRTRTNGKSAHEFKPQENHIQSSRSSLRCGSGSLGRCPLLIVGLVPCYPARHLLPAFGNRGFPATFTHPSYSLGHHPYHMRGDSCSMSPHSHAT